MNSKFLLVLIAVIALSGGLIVGYMQSSQPTDASTGLREKLKTATLLPANLNSLPEFNLVNQHGQVFNRDSLSNDWQLLFFGYTHCPDICPFTMTTLKTVRQLLIGSEIEKHFNVIFISVDPARDTQDHLKTYMDFFSSEFLGVSGSDTELNKLSSALWVVYQRVENKDDPENYLMDHSASLFLIDANGNLIALFSAPHDATIIADDLKTLYTALSQE